MAVEDLVDDFWREALTSNLTGPQAQAKWTTFIYDLQVRVARFPKEALDEVFLRALTRNAECIGIAQVSLDALKKKLGIPASNSRLAEIAAETLVSASIGQGVAAFFAYSADGPVPPPSRMINAPSNNVTGAAGLPGCKLRPSNILSAGRSDKLTAHPSGTGGEHQHQGLLGRCGKAGRSSSLAGRGVHVAG